MFAHKSPGRGCARADVSPNGDRLCRERGSDVGAQGIDQTPRRIETHPDGGQQLLFLASGARVQGLKRTYGT